MKIEEALAVISEAGGGTYRMDLRYFRGRIDRTLGWIGCRGLGKGRSQRGPVASDLSNWLDGDAIS